MKRAAKRAALGEQEGALLKWLAENGPASVGRVVEEFGTVQGLARSTLATMMERLRGKGYLKREKVGSVYHYSPSEPHEAQLRRLVRRFIDCSLGGSLDPFVAYLTDEARLNETQIEQLRQLVRDLDTGILETRESKSGVKTAKRQGHRGTR